MFWTFGSRRNGGKGEADEAAGPGESAAAARAACASDGLGAPVHAPFHLVAAWHDRVLLAAPPGRSLSLDGHPFVPVGTTLEDVDLLSDPDHEAITRHWRTYHDDGHALLGRDIAPQWQLSGGHTAYMQVNLAARGRLDPVEIAYGDPDLGEALPVGTGRVRLQGLVAAHRGVLKVALEFYDAADRFLASERVDVPDAAGGPNPAGYADLGGTVDLPAAATAVRLKILLIPLASAEDAVAFFTHLRLAATRCARRPLADRLCPLAPLAAGLADGSLVLMEAPLPAAPRGAPPRPLTVVDDGTSYPVGTLRGAGGSADIVVEESLLRLRTGRTAGRVSLLADGAWVRDVVAAPAVQADRHDLPLPAALCDGRTHRLELVAGPERLGVAFAAAPWRTTPWERVREDVTPPLPGTQSPLAAYRYSAFIAHAERAARGEGEPWLVGALARLHRALVEGPGRAEPFPIVFARPAEPDVSVVVPVHDGYALTFHALAALRFAAVDVAFEVIVVDDGSTDGTQDHLARHEGLTVLRHESAQGFLRAANAGAALARGRAIVLLNNDTEVTAGWLDGLWQALRRFARAGIVGPKVIYPDGGLQDAGGRVDHDGDPWMVGRGGNPFDPRHAYTREVDYVSGAAMMVDAALWRSAGGFSEAYVPAYFEDVDLCFRAREAGRRVLYAPSAVVVHAEGGSHGTDTAAGIKRHQTVNAPVFKRRWAHRFPPPLPAALAHDRAVTARVLFVCVEIPRNDMDAGSVAAEEEIRLIQALGARVTLLPRNLEYLPGYAEALQARGVEVIHAPFAVSMEAFLEARGGEFDAVYITRFQVAEALMPSIKRFAPRAKVLLNLADLQFLRQMRTAAVAGDDEAVEAARATRARELAAMRTADAVLSYSEVEGAVVFSHAGPEVRVVKAPWVQRLAEAPAPFAPRAGLVFLGNYRHPPNAEAVRWFGGEVMPRIAARRPDIAFTAYGSGAAAALADAANTTVGGHVPDLQAMFDSHRIFVAPLLSGAGVKGKVFQAMAAGIAVVLTPLAAEGIDVRHGEHVLIADDPAGFAEAVLSLHDDAALWQRLVAAARGLIAERYGEAEGIATMRAAFEAAGLFLPVTDRAPRD